VLPLQLVQRVEVIAQPLQVSLQATHWLELLK
jgi:hypothetical protein